MPEGGEAAGEPRGQGAGSYGSAPAPRAPPMSSIAAQLVSSMKQNGGGPGPPAGDGRPVQMKNQAAEFATLTAPEDEPGASRGRASPDAKAQADHAGHRDSASPTLTNLVTAVSVIPRAGRIMRDYESEMQEELEELEPRSEEDKLRVEFSHASSFFVLSGTNPLRRALQKTLLSSWFYWFMIVITFGNFAAIAARDPFCDLEHCPKSIVLDWVDLCFTILFTVEVVMQALARGLVLHRRAYLRSASAWVDVLVVVFGYLALSPELGNLSAIRAIRITRAFRSLKNYLPTLQVLLKSISLVLPTLYQVLLQLFFFFLVFAIVGIQLFEGAYHGRCFDYLTGQLEPSSDWPGPADWPRAMCNAYTSGGRDCDAGLYCDKYLDPVDGHSNPTWGYTGFDNLGLASLVILQSITQSWWTTYMYWANHSTGIYGYIYFVLMVSVGAFLILNIFLAVITNKFQQVDEHDRTTREAAAAARAEAAAAAAAAAPEKAGSAASLFRAVSVAALKLKSASGPQANGAANGAANGSTTARAASARAASARAAPAGAPAAEAPAGDVEQGGGSRKPAGAAWRGAAAKAVVAAVASAASATPPAASPNPSPPPPAPPPLEPEKPAREARGVWAVRVRPFLAGRAFTHAWDVVLAANFVLVCAFSADLFADDGSPATDALRRYRAAEGTLVVILAVLAVLRLVGVGLRALLFGEDLWLAYELVLVVASLAELGVGAERPVANTLRLLELFRLYGKWSKDTAQICSNAWRAAKALGSFMPVYAVITVTVALLGVQLFGAQFNFPNEPWHRSNFDSVYMAYLTVIRIYTLDDWNEPIFASLRALGPAAIIYHAIAAVIGFVILLNVLVTILVIYICDEDEDGEGEGEGEEAASPFMLPRIVGGLRRVGILRRRRRRASRATLSRRDSNGGEAPAPVPRGAVAPMPRIRSSSISSLAPPSLPDLAPSHSLPAAPSAAPSASAAALVPAPAPPSLPLAPRPANGAMRPASGALGGADGAWRGAGGAGEAGASGHHRARFSLSLSNVTKHSIAAELPGPAAEAGEEPIAPRSAPASARTSASSSGGELEEDAQDFGQVLEARALRHAKRALQYSSLWVVPPQWRPRRWAFAFVTNKWTERVVLTVVFVSSLCLAIQAWAPNRDWPGMDGLDNFFLAFFTAEAALKIFALGFLLHPGAYIRDPFNVLDILIVGVAWASWGVDMALTGDGGSQIRALRTLRSLRALRPLRFVSRLQGLREVIDAFSAAAPGLLRALVANLILFSTFASLGMRLFAGRFGSCSDGSRETRAACLEQDTFDAVPDFGPQTSTPTASEWSNVGPNFDGYGRAMQTVYEIVSLEGWTSYMWNGQDAVGVGRSMRTNVWPMAAWFFHMIVLVCQTFGFGMLVAILVNAFHHARQMSELESTTDPTKGKGLSDEQKEWREALLMGVSTSLRKKMNPPESGPRLYLYRMVTSPKFDLAIMSMVGVNVLVLATQRFPRTPTEDRYLEVCNVLFVAFFALEAAVKLLALFPRVYFSSGWNVFDFVLVLIGCGGVLVQYATDVQINGSFLRVLRVFRLVRIFRLVRRLKGLRMVLETFARCVTSLMNVGLLLGLLYFIFGCIGVQVFGNTKYGPGGGTSMDANFGDLPTALITLFRMTTGENWNNIMWDSSVTDGCTTDCGSALAPLYFIPFHFVACVLGMQIFVAIVLDAFDIISAREEHAIKERHVEQFVAAWEGLDPEASGFVPVSLALRRLLTAVDEPLGIDSNAARLAVMAKLRSLRIPAADGRVHFYDVLTGMVADVYEAAGTHLPEPIRVRFEKLGHRRFAGLAEHHERARESDDAYVLFCIVLLQTTFRRLRARDKTRAELGLPPRRGSVFQAARAAAPRPDTSASAAPSALAPERASSPGADERRPQSEAAAVEWVPLGGPRTPSPQGPALAPSTRRATPPRAEGAPEPRGYTVSDSDAELEQRAKQAGGSPKSSPASAASSPGRRNGARAATERRSESASARPARRLPPLPMRPHGGLKGEAAAPEPAPPSAPSRTSPRSRIFPPSEHA